MAVVTNPDWSKYDILTVVEAAVAGNAAAIEDLKVRAQGGDPDAEMVLRDLGLDSKDSGSHTGE